MIIKEIESGVEYELNFSKENQYYIEIENISKSSDYELNIYHENNHYQSKNILQRSPPIGDVKQGQRKSLNNDEIEIVTSFKDIENDDNYYLFEFGKGNLQPADDIYIEGNNFTFSYFINKNKIQNNINNNNLCCMIPFITPQGDRTLDHQSKSLALYRLS